MPQAGMLGAMVERRLKDRYAEAERWTEEVTVIGKGFVFEGGIRAEDVVVVAGRVTGPVSSEALVHVLEGGVVCGDVSGKAVLIEGAVDGDIHADEQLELGKTSRVRGNVHGPRVALAEGAYLRGKVKASSGSVKRFRERRG